MSTPIKSAEERARQFYNTVGWENEKGISEDAKRWEDLRECAKDYVSKCRLRICEHIPQYGNNMLDMASGPIQYPEYLEYSKNFNKRYCIDLSAKALEEAKLKIGSHGEFLHGSFFDISLEKEFFDCAISLHTIFHIDKNQQEIAIRKLIDVTKPGKPVIIVYGNPDTIESKLKSFSPRKIFKQFKKVICKKNNNHKQKITLYFHLFPLRWWERFNDVAEVKILPWRSFDSATQKILFPNNGFGRKMFNVLYYLEDRFPNFFARYFQYPMIILTKKAV